MRSRNAMRRRANTPTPCGPLEEAIRRQPRLGKQAAADPLFAKMRELAKFKRLVTP
jgi:hypothetical protein